MDHLKFDRLRFRLQQGTRLKVLFLNDIGFQYGAGIAQLRQIQSFLMMGHEVQGLCWIQGAVEGNIPVVTYNTKGTWRGMRQLPNVHAQRGCDNSTILNGVLAEVNAYAPDIVIVGNIHDSGWPIELLPAIRDTGALVIAYMHDCYFITGRCAHPFDCTLYQRGCDDTCHTWQNYPSLAKEKIADAWRLRQKTFGPSDKICIAANSEWTLKMAKGAIKEPHFAEVVYLGLDLRIFKPIERTLARRLLGLPEDRFIILGGAVNINDPHKGGHLFKEIVSRLSQKAVFLVFGAETMTLDGVTATGLLRDFRKMPLLYSAADLFMGTSLAESFGQTYLEAAACALPTVAFKIGGIPEVARHTINARLVDDLNVDTFINEIDFFMNDPKERESYGQAGRAMVESEFTLEKQAERWTDYLLKATAR